MIDLHCHILPGIDDGAEDINASIAMAEKAISQGITHILCTPHHNNGKYRNPKSEVISLVTSLQEELDARSLSLTVLEGQEVRITGDLIEDIQKNNILFTDLDDTYILIEFPTIEVPTYTKQSTSSNEYPLIFPTKIFSKTASSFRSLSNNSSSYNFSPGRIPVSIISISSSL